MEVFLYSIFLPAGCHPPGTPLLLHVAIQPETIQYRMIHQHLSGIHCRDTCLPTTRLRTCPFRSYKIPFLGNCPLQTRRHRLYHLQIWIRPIVDQISHKVSWDGLSHKTITILRQSTYLAMPLIIFELTSIFISILPSGQGDSEQQLSHKHMHAETSYGIPENPFHLLIDWVCERVDNAEKEERRQKIFVLVWLPKSAGY